MSWLVGLYAVLALAFAVGPAARFWMAWQLHRYQALSERVNDPRSDSIVGMCQAH